MNLRSKPVLFVQVSRKFFLLLLWLLSLPLSAHERSYQYFRVGQNSYVQSKPEFGVALMGGGSDIDGAFRWFCGRANGGDFLVLRANGDDAYNAYLYALCRLNSVATLVIPDRKTAQDPRVSDIIQHAAAIFIAGGDQAHYVREWRGTAVQEALNTHIMRGKPIAGTSAGLAILGQFSYGALNDPPDSMLTSSEALENPFTDRVTLVENFISIPLLRATITDSHFVKRDRLGRSLVFLARLMQDGWARTPRVIAVDERSALLVGPKGEARVVGPGQGAYFLSAAQAPAICRKGTPLTFFGISVFKASAGGSFDLTTWAGKGGARYQLNVTSGVITSTQPGGSPY